jgi:flagellar motor switch protein FliG
VPPLTGPQKAATVLAQMDSQRAAQALKGLSESEVVMLMTEMAKLPQLDAKVVSDVVGEFLDEVTGIVAVQQGGAEAARALLAERLGADRADEVMEQVYVGGDGPLMLLHRLDAVQVTAFLAEEHPQTIAVVLVHLSPDRAAEILGKMDEKVRVDVADRIAIMGRIDPQVVQEVATVFERKFATLLQPGGGSTRMAAGGIPALVSILNNVDRSSEKLILTELDALDPEVAEKVRNQLFVFDDVVALDDRTLQRVLRSVVPKDLAVALKGVEDSVRDKFLRNLSERAAQDLVDEMEILGPTRLSTVESAQMQLVKIVREMEEAGEIVLTRGDDDLVV